MNIQEDLIYGFISTCEITLGHVATDYDDGDYQIFGGSLLGIERKRFFMILMVMENKVALEVNIS